MARDYVIIHGELYHFGVLGMKWGVRNLKDMSLLERLKARSLEREKNAIVQDAKKIKFAAPPGQIVAVTGKYKMRNEYGHYQVCHHYFNDKGKVVMSYMRGSHGDRYIAGSREAVSKMNMSQHFYKPPKESQIEYDVYD